MREQISWGSMKCFLVVNNKIQLQCIEFFYYGQNVSPTASAWIESNTKVPSLQTAADDAESISKPSHWPRLSVLLMLNFRMDIVLRAIDFPVSLSHSSQPTYSDWSSFLSHPFITGLPILIEDCLLVKSTSLNICFLDRKNRWSVSNTVEKDAFSLLFRQKTRWSASNIVENMHTHCFLDRKLDGAF